MENRNCIKWEIIRNVANILIHWGLAVLHQMFADGKKIYMLHLLTFEPLTPLCLWARHLNISLPKIDWAFRDESYKVACALCNVKFNGSKDEFNSHYVSLKICVPALCCQFIEARWGILILDVSTTKKSLRP